MFSLIMRDPFGCRGVSCVKLPAAVAFPTDDRLMQRIEASRRALPPDNMKSLRKHSVQRVRELDVHEMPRAEVSRVPFDKLSVPGESRPISLQLVRIEELYLRNKVAVAQR